jgi:hypothetical protein
MRIKADVEETEAIWTGYSEGVLEKIWWELELRRRAGARKEAVPAMKKSKAAKRKQQKRKAQQQKKAAEMAEAAAVTAAAGGGELTQGEAEIRSQEQALGEEQREDEQKIERSEDAGMSKEEEDSSGNQHPVTAVTEDLKAMALGERKKEVEKEEEEEEEEEECSVCLVAIESDDVDNPAGPPLVCGHRYHALCLQVWVEKCASRCIAPTCPYCRSPLQDLNST